MRCWVRKTLTAAVLLPFASVVGCDGLLGAAPFPKTTEWASATVNNDAGPRPVVVAVADFDGDGDLDVVTGYAGATGTDPLVAILFQTSPVSFTATQIASGTILDGLAALAVADVDGDGLLDVIVACNGRILYLRSPADPSEGAGWSTSTVAQSDGAGVGQWSDVAIADIDAANRPDIVASNQTTGLLSFFRAPADAGSGDNWTRVDMDAATRAGAAGVATGDVDGDGRMDVYSTAVDETTDRVAWYRNPGGDSSGAWTKNTIGNLPGTRIEVGDLDQDSDVDVVVVEPVNRQVGWYVRPTDPTGDWSGFLLTQFTTNTPVDVKISDVDANGQNDVVVSTRDNGGLRWFTPVGGQTLQWVENNLIDLIDNLGRIAIGNIDGDARDDVIFPLSATDPVNDQVAWVRNPE